MLTINSPATSEVNVCEVGERRGHTCTTVVASRWSVYKRASPETILFWLVVFEHRGAKKEFGREEEQKRKIFDTN